MKPELLLRLEEQQLRHFLTGVRQVGEEKSELYPEPQYFNLTMMSGALRLPETVEKIIRRAGSEDGYAKRIKRVLSGTSAVQLTGIQLMSNWGREMLRDEAALVGKSGYLHGSPELSDRQLANVMRFAHRVVCAYREDGQAYPSMTGAYGADYRLLTPADVAPILQTTRTVDAQGAREILSLLAVVRSLSFLMEAETRDALMMHGPYPTNEGDSHLIVFECADLRWTLFPNFRLPRDARWVLPRTPLPIGNLAIALVVRDTCITADRFGTLYMDPFAPENIVAGSLLTRGEDEFRDDGLTEIDINEASALRREADAIQNSMFLQLASWDFEQRLTAGAQEEQMFHLRMLAAAGYNRAEIEAEQQLLLDFHDEIWPVYFDAISKREPSQIPFFRRMEAFAKGEIPTLYSPLRL